MAGNGGKPVDFVRKSLIVIGLFGALFLLHHYADPTAPNQSGTLLALGFVVLAAFLIGELVEVIKLPHITGYLLAGLALGPSLPHMLHGIDLPHPFNHGILNEDIKNSLQLLNTLALPLICLTAGGALRPTEIRKAIRPISGVLIGQMVVMFVAIILFFYLCSGPIAWLQIEALHGLPLGAIITIGGVIAAISLATSDAATIAIVVSVKAKGPMTTNIVSVAVIKDIVVVVAFSAMMTLSLSSLDMGGGAGLGLMIALIVLSAILGGGLGWVLHLYVKHVKAEVLLFLTAVIYTVSFIAMFGAKYFHLGDGMGDALSAITFIAAGFVAANYSEFGDELISDVEKLSMPVFVVFFTLAGASLHLDQLFDMLLLGVLLVVVRAAAFYIGVRVGATLTKADEGSRNYAWMGFVSQAGLAITLAQLVKNTFSPAGSDSELGNAVFSLILAGVAINEIIGPAMLQASLSLAGEIPRDAPAQDTQPVSSQKKGHVAVTGWGVLPKVSEASLQAVFESTLQSLHNITQGIVQAVLTPRQKKLENLIEQVKRCSDQEQKRLLLHKAAQDFSKNHILHVWDSEKTFRKLDRLADALDDDVVLSVEPTTLVAHDEDTAFLRIFRLLAALRNRISPLKRTVDIRAVGRYHFSGHCYTELIGFAEAMVALERDMAQAVEDLALNKDDALISLQECLQQFTTVEERLTNIVARQHQRFCHDLVHLATFRLPSWHRRFGRAIAERNTGLEALTDAFVVNNGYGKSSVEGIIQGRWEASTVAIAFAGFSRRVKQRVDPVLQEFHKVQQHYQELENLYLSIENWLQKASTLLANNSLEIKEQTEHLLQQIFKMEAEASSILQKISSNELQKHLAQAFVQETGEFVEVASLPTNRSSADWRLLQQHMAQKRSIRPFIVGFSQAQLTSAVRNTLLAFRVPMQASEQLLTELLRALRYNLSTVVEEITYPEQNQKLDNDDFKAILIDSTERLQHRMLRDVMPHLDAEIKRFPGIWEERLQSSLQLLSSQLLTGTRWGEDDTSLTSANVLSKIMSQANQLWLRLMDTEPEPETQDGVFTLPYERNNLLSEVYIRLFNAYRSDAQSLSQSRSIMRDRILDGLDRQKSIALVGTYPEVISLAENILHHCKADAEVIRPSHPVNTEQLQQWQDAYRGKLVVLIGLRWFFSADDRSTLDLLGRMLQDKSTTRWLIVADRHVWRALQRLSVFENYLAQVMMLGSMSVEEMKTAILSRHQMSGYELEFPEPQGFRTRVMKTFAEENQERHWFAQLHTCSGGELEEAFMLWLASIHSFDEERGMMSLNWKFPQLLQQFSRLQSDELLLLRQLLRQGWADVPSVMSWFGEAEFQALSRLHRLENIKLIYEQDEIWHLTSRLRYPLQVTLEKRGWL